MTRARRLAGRLPLPVLLTGLIGFLLWYVNSLRHDPPATVLLVVAGGVIVTLIVWIFGEASEQVRPAHWHSDNRQESAAPPPLDHRLVRLRRDLRDTLERNDRRDAIHSLLVELAADRLRAQHGIDLATDPESAREVLPADLYGYLTTAPAGTARGSRRQLHTVIDQIEAL